MTRINKAIRSAGLSLILIFLAFPAFAAIPNADNTGLNASAEAAGYGKEATPITMVIGQGIGIIISISGVLLGLYMFYGGILWMTASGDSTKIETAKGMIVNAVIGLAIILVAFSATTFVVNQLSDASQGNAGSAGTSSTY